MRHPVSSGAPVVVKVGSSSLMDDKGGLSEDSVDQVVHQVAALWSRGNPTVLVSSGAVAAGLPGMGLTERPADTAGLQVAAAVGQGRLMSLYTRRFGFHDRAVAQVLLTKEVLSRREQYLNARDALTRMLDLGIVPVVNENDTVAVDELRFGDNDRLAAIASHLVGAGMLVILTDTAGLYSEDPRVSESALLVEAVSNTDALLGEMLGRVGAGYHGSGGVATKVAAAQMASWSGIPTIIASAADPDAAVRAVVGEPVGTWIAPHTARLSSRKLWIAFGLPSRGRVMVDGGAAKALTQRGKSLLAAGVSEVEGDFGSGDAVEVFHEDHMIAKGLASMTSDAIRAGRGRHSSSVGGEFIHRDDLVVLA